MTQKITIEDCEKAYEAAKLAIASFSDKVRKDDLFAESLVDFQESADAAIKKLKDTDERAKQVSGTTLPINPDQPDHFSEVLERFQQVMMSIPSEVARVKTAGYPDFLQASAFVSYLSISANAMDMIEQHGFANKSDTDIKRVR